MESIDRLREWFDELGYCDDGTLYKLLDAIEAEVEDERKAKDGQSWLRGYAECRAELMEGNEVVAASLEEAGWVRLPLDADGVPIRVGDVMEHGKAHGHVIALMLSNYPKKWGGALHWGIQLEGEKAPTALDAFYHHYHAPTVEDVLREFAYGLGVPVADSYVAATAAKLRLAEGSE